MTKRVTGPVSLSYSLSYLYGVPRRWRCSHSLRRLPYGLYAPENVRAADTGTVGIKVYGNCKRRDYEK